MMDQIPVSVIFFIVCTHEILEKVFINILIIHLNIYYYFKSHYENLQKCLAEM